MKIVGFGDSFILGVTPNHTEWPHTYQGLVSEKLNADVEFRGQPGTGPWSAFFDFLEYQKPIDVAIFAWSEPSRLYHPVVKPLNVASVRYDIKNYDHPHYDVIEAADLYYGCLMDHRKKNYELTALMNLIDTMSLDFPNTKFVHLHCFGKDEPGEWWGDTYETIKQDKLKYHHIFKNGIQIHPPLMYMSVKHEWMGKDKLFIENRQCHLSLDMHKLLADAIVESIQNYVPNKIINIDLSPYDKK